MHVLLRRIARCAMLACSLVASIVAAPLRKIGYDPFPGSSDKLARFAESETAKWGRIIKAASIEPE